MQKHTHSHSLVSDTVSCICRCPYKAQLANNTQTHTHKWWSPHTLTIFPCTVLAFTNHIWCHLTRQSSQSANTHEERGSYPHLVMICLKTCGWSFPWNIFCSRSDTPTKAASSALYDYNHTEHRAGMCIDRSDWRLWVYTVLHKQTHQGKHTTQVYIMMQLMLNIICNMIHRSAWKHSLSLTYAQCMDTRTLQRETIIPRLKTWNGRRNDEKEGIR